MKITLCGSSRFSDMFRDWNLKLSLAGHVVYGLAAGERVISDGDKITLDLIHLAKIDNSDAVFVLDGTVAGAPYIGASTAREIAWARLKNKAVFYFSNGAGARLIGAFRVATAAPEASRPDGHLRTIPDDELRAREDQMREGAAGLAGDAAAERMLGEIERQEIETGPIVPADSAAIARAATREETPA